MVPREPKQLTRGKVETYYTCPNIIVCVAIGYFGSGKVHRSSLVDTCIYTNYTKKSLKIINLSLVFSPSQSKSGFYAIASQMKLLVDTPEKVLHWC